MTTSTDLVAELAAAIERQHEALDWLIAAMIAARPGFRWEDHSVLAGAIEAGRVAFEKAKGYRL